MRIGILGDSHEQVKDIDRCIKKLNNVNIIIHTGDMLKDALYITRKHNIPVIGVRGNCDPYNAGEEEILYTANNYNILICHGHNYGVKSSLKMILHRGKNANAHIIVFGHTHIPYYEQVDSIHLLNPGSLAFPRGFSKKSVAIIEINERISIKHIEV
ncbi:metallophosphoesterase family protein [Serpentinicella alkaliphila]|uniref:Phosphoesterase n=1 Tax=Serpentinicella alkaliphila TaxID=1734049 RepID=A0A4R2U6V3_9FIRM|nr:metallophosphoesterase [Serpentinicella alkaliphila]QUH24815.1 metallophosphoesterase [Serpentinicella alkaliphila]TCQ03483.1 hypothetical protein EDD79_100963 [Serpentinicella alkaliphila]